MIRQLSLHNGHARPIFSLLLVVGPFKTWSACHCPGWRVRPGSIKLSCGGRPEAPASRPNQFSRRLIGYKSLVVEFLAKGLVGHPLEMVAQSRRFLDLSSST